MKRKNHTPDQIVKKLRQADARLAEGLRIDQVCKELGVSDATYYKWRKEYGHMQVDQVKQLKQLQKENDRLKKVVADLLSMDLEVIIGPMTSSMAMNMVPLVNASSTVMVSPTVTTTDLSAIDDQFIRVISATTVYADKSARYQYETLGHRRGAAIYDLNNQSYTESWLRDFQRVFESLGGTIAKTHAFRSGEKTAFFEEARKLLDTRPDFLLIISNAVDAALICQQVRKLDQHITLVMAEWAATERLIELGGAATEDVLVAQFLDRNNTSERYQAFRQAYLDRFKQEPGFAGIAGYDAAFVVLSALSDRTPGESLKDTIIEKAMFKCVQQIITIDRFGDADRPTYITTIKNGTFLKIEQ